MTSVVATEDENSSGATSARREEQQTRHEPGIAERFVTYA